MAKLSLKDRIKAYLDKRGDWVNGGKIEELAMAVHREGKVGGYKASNASRRCREMESGIDSQGKPCPIVIESKIENGSVWYRSLTPLKRQDVWRTLPDGSRELLKTIYE